MSQRECAGFNWPGFPVSAGEPLGVGPRASDRTFSLAVGVAQGAITNAACSGMFTPRARSLESAPSFPSFARGVTSFSGLAFCPCMLLADDFQSRAAGVGQGDRAAALWRFSPPSRPCVPDPVPLLLVGVGHPPQSLPDVRGADARRAQIGGPDSMSQCLQVSANSGEPSPSILARNLLSKDDWRAALRNEAAELGPEVALVIDPASFAGGGEGLAGTGPGPDGPVVRPASQSKSEGPSADAREEVRLRVALEVVRLDIGNAPGVDVAGRDVPFGDQLAQPCGRAGVEFVVVGARGADLRRRHPAALRDP